MHAYGNVVTVSEGIRRSVYPPRDSNDRDLLRGVNLDILCRVVGQFYFTVSPRRR